MSCKICTVEHEGLCRTEIALRAAHKHIVSLKDDNKDYKHYPDELKTYIDTSRLNIARALSRVNPEWWH